MDRLSYRQKKNPSSSTEMLFRLQSLIALCLCRCTAAFPAWASLAGLSDNEIDYFARTVTVIGAKPPPGPNPNTLSTLVNDAAHPYRPPRRNDIRGPCPGLNTLASHGVCFFNCIFVVTFNVFCVLLQYLNRNGIVTPQDVVNAVQTGQTIIRPHALHPYYI